MSDTTRTEKYSNITSVPIRTRIALMFILLAIKICEPWEYSHQFTSELSALSELLRGKQTDKEAKNAK